MNRFHEKTVIVTGAGSGIGEATVRRFAEEGANVVLAGRRLAPMQRVAEDFSPDRTLVLQIDVSVRQDVQRMIEAALVRFQKLDVLVNNAGVQIAGDVLKNSLENWRKVAATNLDGVVYSSSLALPHLIRSQGCIVNVASVSGLAGDWGGPYYCAAKGAVVNFTRAMALDHGVQGVRINAVCPSLVMTPMTGHFSDDVLQSFYQRIPLGRAGTTTEVAAAIAFLASEDASFINGVNLPVDGGVTASNGQPQLPLM